MIQPSTDVVLIKKPSIDVDEACKLFNEYHAPKDAIDGFLHVFGNMLAYEVDPAFLAWIFKHESLCGTAGICAKYNTKNPGNVRSSSTGKGIAIQTERGQFIKFSTWVDGWTDMFHRLRNPKYPYTQRHLTNIHDILNVWAPSDDNNNPSAYIADVVTGMNRTYIEMPSDRYSKIGDYPVVWIPAPPQNYDTSRETIIGIGVHDIEGSAQSALNTLLDPERGASTHFIIDDVNRRFVQMVGLYSTAWTLGNYYYNQRAINIEQPGYAGRPYSPIVVEMMGVLSGFLCSEFQIPIIRCNRSDIESSRPGYWAHSDIPDPDSPGLYGGKDNHTDPGNTYPWEVMLATAKGFAGDGVPSSAYFPQTNYGCAGGFFQRFSNSGGVDIFGYPISREFDTTDTTGVDIRVQYFERARMEWRPNMWPEKWDVFLGLLGTEQFTDTTWIHWNNQPLDHPVAFTPYKNQEEWENRQ